MCVLRSNLRDVCPATRTRGLYLLATLELLKRNHISEKGKKERFLVSQISE